LLFTGVAFLLCGYGNLHLRYFKAGGVFLGVLSHLMVDEIYSVEWTRGRWRFKSSFGTALKLWGNSAWGNFSVYLKLAVVAVLILSEPMVMERYGQLSPIVVNNQAVRDRLRLSPTGVPAPTPPLDLPATAFVAVDPNAFPPAGPTTTWQSVGPTAGSSPYDMSAPSPRGGDRTIYDTARRIWERFRN
jgi:hypothetical protein